jgi:hypothetical protein
MKKILVYIVSVFVAVTAIGCTSDCYVSRESKLGISLIDSTTYKAKTLKGLTVIGVGSDSILYNNANVSAIYIPLHINNNITDYKLILPTIVEGKATPDTILLHIEHTPMPQLISEECGCAMFHRINNVTLENNTYNFKMQVTNPNVVNDDNETDINKDTNIKILH